VTLPTTGTYTATVTFQNAIGTGTASLQTAIRALNGNIYSTGYAEERFDQNVNWPRNLVDTNGAWWVETSLTIAGTNWTRSTLAAVSQPASLFIPNNTTAAGTVRSLISPNLNLTGVPPNSRLRFRIASAPRATANSDELRMFYSTNCGNSWVQMSYTRSGTSNPSIYTVTGTRTFPFIPSGTEWRQEAVAIPLAAINAQRVMFRWQYTNAASLGLYLDDIMVGDSTLVSAAKTQKQVSHLATVFPNPGNQHNTQLQLHTTQGLPTCISIRDLLGRGQTRTLQTTTDKSSYSIHDLAGQNLAPGLYTVTVQQGDERQVLKVVLQ
jgi:hypothetical protein